MNRQNLAVAAFLLAVAAGLGALLVNASKQDKAREACGVHAYLTTDGKCVAFKD